MKKLIETVKDEWREMRTRPLSLVGWIVGITTGLGTQILAVTETVDKSIVIWIEAILLALLLYKYCNLKINAITLDNLYDGNVPMTATLSYIMNARKRERYNQFDATSVTVKYDFQGVPGSVDMVMQTITWDFHVKNTTAEPICCAFLMVSKSVFSHFEDIDIEAKDLDTGNPLNVYRDNRRAQQYLVISFEGEGIPVGSLRGYQVTMRWKKPYRFQETEYFILDPLNYAKKIHEINIVIESDHAIFKDALVTHLGLSRHTVTYKHPEYTVVLRENSDKKYIDARRFSPSMGKLYLVKVQPSNLFHDEQQQCC